MSLKPHVAINVEDLDRSLAFYRRLFGEEPVKVRPGYAKFDLEDPALNFTLNEGGEVSGGINHFGVQVASTEEVLAARQRLEQAGLAAFDEMDTTCCYAVQDKIWVTSPDGHAWEVFVVKADAPMHGKADGGEPREPGREPEPSGAPVGSACCACCA